ncbi:butyrophilin subfamily 1 member A1-like isoform X3 [Larus michahellis]|uniref:butyrophilin subfamily 1 member A1-like isoform X3 n=1 Tax=Larus michahellis TaxID=119627 RepID=UPI003D9B8218
MRQCFTRFDARAHLIIYCIEAGVRQALRETLPLSPEVQKGPPGFLNSSSERSLAAAGSNPSPRLGQRFMSKGLYTRNQSLDPLAKMSKFSVLLVTYRESVAARNLSASRRRTLSERPHSRGDPVVQPLPCRRAQRALGLSTVYGLRLQMGFPASPRGLLSYFLTLHVLRLGSAEFRVVGPDRPLLATVGQDVVLPCHLSPRADARSLEIRWIRYRFSETVHLYRNGEDLDGAQMEEYIGRTQLVRDGLSNGTLDLRLPGVRPSDDGQYVCTVRDAASYGEATVDLEVAAMGSVPLLSLEAHQDGGIRVVCGSAGWYPQPEVLWKAASGQRLPSVSQRRSSDERGLFEIQDVVVVSGKGDGNLSCVVRNSRLEQEQASSLHISAPFFHNALHWMAALGSVLLLLVALFGVIAYLWRRKVGLSRTLEEQAAALVPKLKDLGFCLSSVRSCRSCHGMGSRPLSPLIALSFCFQRNKLHCWGNKTQHWRKKLHGWRNKLHGWRKKLHGWGNETWHWGNETQHWRNETQHWGNETRHWVSLRDLLLPRCSLLGSVLSPFPPCPSPPSLHPLGVWKPRGDVPGRVGSSGTPDQEWTLSPWPLLGHQCWDGSRKTRSSTGGTTCTSEGTSCTAGGTRCSTGGTSCTAGETRRGTGETRHSTGGTTWTSEGTSCTAGTSLGMVVPVSLEPFFHARGSFLKRRSLGSAREKQAALLAWRKFLLPENQDVVTLDPNTAHSQLHLSEDLRTVNRDIKEDDLPDTPERFSDRCCVLGREGFREGRHCWEVEVKGEVGGDSQWGVGVARESVERKGSTVVSPERGIWAVQHHLGHFMSLTSPRTLLPQSPLPSRIWVCLDCARGLVTFLDADTGVEIFTFPPASFKGETLCPWFWVGTEKTQLCLRDSTS